ncbi:uncharacterized protein FFB20_15249 [Fusarium fujikuroi]|nr:uncharacterized protein FFE2_02370 [Fusarium fujikuroi]SCO17471.1 uncharacterized protein FFB20_15249 [Fusarium fujikuroi]SCO26071.1 uncharacterized protein FFC1_15821 [Fusarium fujikuroi]SCO35467.1 uncharacterized protein FFNC_04483 [Fusarium fujikuroi]SCV36939.1 uncharacterized protein FFFS_05435 [Fusarium fujikuroi]
MASSNPSGSSIPGPQPSQVSVPENETEPEGHKTLKSHLMSAIQTDNVEEVERLLDQNSFLTNAAICYEVEYNQGSIECQVLPVTIAAKFGRVAILDILLSNFTANIDAPIYSTRTSSLHLAANMAGWSLSGFSYLTERRSIGQTYGGGLLCITHPEMATQILKHTAFSLACYHGSLELQKLLWNQGPETQISLRDQRGNQPLHHAVFNNNHRVIPWLLKKQADIEAYGEGGLTPLCAAAEALLSQGAYIHARSNIGKAIPILYASTRLDSRLSVLLQEYCASLLDTDKRGYNCFHRMLENEGGSWRDFLDVTIQFVAGGANINHLSDGDPSPLASACLEGKLGEARILIDFGADVNQCGSSTGVTPLTMACKRPKNNKVIAMLLDRGADATKTHRHGGTALSIACLAGDSENVETLIARGIDVAHFDRHCHTPLFNAAMKGHFDIMLQVLRTATYFPSNPTNKRAFTDPRQSREVIGKAVLKALEHLPDLPQEDLHTIMYWAVANDYPSLVKKCIEIDNSIVQKTREKANWLHTAAQHSSSQVIHFVSEAGVSEKATNGNTAMHYAAFSGSLETAEELFKLVVTGCPVNTAHAKVRLVMQRNVWDYTPISMAVSGRHKAVMDLFWEEIRCLGTVDKDYLRTHEEQAVEILELVARLEKPGHEETLRHLLEQWCMREPDPQMTTLELAANDEAELFKVFHEALEAERGQQHESTHRAGHAVKVMPSNPYHIISPETTLLEKIRDIRDELRILSTLADDQDAVWKQMLPSYTANGKLRYYYLYTPADAKHDLTGLITEAETAHGSINLLLDLRQKQASIKEAEFGRIQANDSARQSNSILIFTIVTIIFRAQLPLSFLSSLFALDVSSFPHESGDLKYQGWWLFPILFGVTAIVSVPTIILAWKINKVSDWWNKLEPGVQNGQRFEREADDIGSHSSRRRRFGGAVRKRNTGGDGIA